MATAADDATAELLGGRYRLESVIGRGGVSTVYQAHDESLGRKVAIKRLDVGPVDPAREEIELAILASLDHHNLVTMLDAGSHRDASGRLVRYIVMPLVRGMDLQQRLRGSRIAARNVAEIGYDIAEALEYIHAQNVVHRDVKPSNILLVDYGNATPRARAQLTDFGIAVADHIERITDIGTTTGTAAYLSPEQAAGERIGPPSDIYSAGLVLLQCFTRATEFPGTPVESAVARLSRQPRIPDYLPKHWQNLLGSMTARNPAERPSSRELVPALRQVVIAESGRHKGQPFFSADEDDRGVMDTIPNEALHRITVMAARLLDAPIAVVSIQDQEHTWLVSHYGEEVEQIVRQIDLSGPGAHRDEPVIVEDALNHPEMRETPLAHPPIGIRFYAGVPLKGADGRTIGTLSIADFRPGAVSPDQLQNLQDLAALVVAQLDARQEGLRTADPRNSTGDGDPTPSGL